MKELFETLQTLSIIELHMSANDYSYSVTFYTPGLEHKNACVTLTAHTAADLKDAIQLLFK